MKTKGATIHDTCMYSYYIIIYILEPFLRGNPNKRPTLLERPFDTVNLDINVLISAPDERPPLLKEHFSGAKGVQLYRKQNCSLPKVTPVRTRGQ